MRSAGTPDVKQCLTEHGLGELIRRGLALDLWCSHWMFIPVIPGVLSVWAVLGISLSLTAGSECAGGSSTERFPPEFPRGFGVCAANDFQGNPRLIQLLITLRQKVGSPSGFFPSGGGRVGSYVWLRGFQFDCQFVQGTGEDSTISKPLSSTDWPWLATCHDLPGGFAEAAVPAIAGWYAEHWAFQQDLKFNKFNRFPQSSPSASLRLYLKHEMNVCKNWVPLWHT